MITAFFAVSQKQLFIGLTGAILAAGLSLFIPFLAAASGEPAVVTETPSSVDVTSAELAGRITPQGSAARFKFEYGTDASVSRSTSWRSAGSGSLPVDVNETVSGLEPDTLYYYRLVGENDSGTARGEMLTFLTKKSLAPEVSTNSASSVMPNSAVLNGTVNPTGSAASAWFEWGTSSSLGNSTTHQSVGNGNAYINFSASLTGLSGNTAYYFRAAAENRFGKTVGQILSFVTPPELGPKPSVLTNPATGIGGTSATLNGAVSPNGQAANAWFEFSADQLSWTPVGIRSVGNGTKFLNYSFKLTGLNPATVYFFRAAAENIHGKSTAGVLSFATAGDSPAVFTGTPTSVGQTSAVLQGTVDPNGVSTDVWFEFGAGGSTDRILGYQSAGSGGSPRSFSFTVRDLAAGSAYSYRAAAESAAGTVRGELVSFTTAQSAGGGGSDGRQPSVGTNSATLTDPTTVILSGSATPNGRKTTAWFEYGLTESLGTARGRQSAGSGTASVQYAAVISGLNRNTKYYFRAAAENDRGLTQGPMLTFTTGRSAPGPGPIVTTGAATGASQNSAVLNGWINPNTNNVSTEIWFEYGVTPALGLPIKKGYVNPGFSDQSVSHLLTGLLPQTVYYYRLVAQNGYGSAAGTVLSFVTAGTGGGGGVLPNLPSTITWPASAIGGNSALLNSSLNPGGALSTAWFEWGETAALGHKTVPQAVGAGTASLSFAYAFAGLEANRTYYFRSAVENAYGTAYGATLSFNTGVSSAALPVPPPAPLPAESAARPALALVPGASPPSPRAGDVLRYDISYENTGTLPIEDGALSVSLPGEVVFLESDSLVSAEEGKEFNYPIGLLNAASGAAVSVTVKVKDDIAAGAPLVFRVVAEYRNGNGRTYTAQSVLALTASAPSAGGGGSFFAALLGAINPARGFLNFLLLLAVVLVPAFFIYRFFVRREREEKENEGGGPAGEPGKRSIFVGSAPIPGA